jgi:hypothetical protein
MNKLLKPYFERQLVEDKRDDGYWIEAFDIDDDSKIDIVGYGLGVGEVNWYQNPSWHKRTIAKYLGPVGMHHGDINQDGNLDIIICYQYGQTMVNADPTGGKIDWLENPGDPDGEWKRHYIGRATSMHRLKVGYFTQEAKLEVLALPIVGRPNDVHSIVPVKLFTQPEDLENATQWHEHIIDQGNYHVIHGVSIKKYHQLFGIKPNINLDSALIASEEGITWLYYDPQEKQWHRKLIGTGEVTQASKTGFKGSGNVDLGKIGDDKSAYIPTVEPFHGNTVAVYYKDKKSQPSPGWDYSWQRLVLDVYDNPNPLGEGPGHFVICADFDGDGDDEFLVALRGPEPWQGVYYYKVIDLEKGAFVKWRVSSDSAARIAVADFNGDGRLDFATIGYSVAGYYTADNPLIAIFYNRFAPVSELTIKEINMNATQLAQITTDPACKAVVEFLSVLETKEVDNLLTIWAEDCLFELPFSHKGIPGLEYPKFRGRQ